MVYYLYLTLRHNAGGRGHNPAPTPNPMPFIFHPFTTGNRDFAECQKSGTRQRPSLPSAALGKELHSAKSSLPSAGTSLPSARLSAKARHSA